MSILGGYPFIDPYDIPSLSELAADGEPATECPACGWTLLVGDELDGLYGERLVNECPNCGMTPREWELERKGLGGR